MKLISSPASPFVRKVRVVLHETGLAAQVTEVPVATTALTPAAEARAANPTAKIPALVLADGRAIYDSRVITRYLDDLAGAGLYPQGEALWDVLTLEALADGLLEAAVLMVYEARLRPPAQQSPDWIAAQWAKVEGALDALETGWIAHLDGAHREGAHREGALTAGHVAVGCACGYLDFRHGARNWRDGRDRLAQWYERFAARPAMQATQPAG